MPAITNTFRPVYVVGSIRNTCTRPPHKQEEDGYSKRQSHLTQFKFVVVTGLVTRIRVNKESNRLCLELPR